MRYEAILTNGSKNLIVKFEEELDEVSDLVCGAIFAASEEDMSLFHETDAVWVREVREGSTGRLLYLQEADLLTEALQDALASDPNPFEA